jgi:gamma-glutamyltranspeptidase/glutathione hydrolase
MNEMHTRFATKSLTELLQPVINQARAGWVINDQFAGVLKSSNATLSLWPSTRAIYFDANGETKKSGDTIYNPDLADTFQRLIDYGFNDFYTGEIAQSIISAIQNDTNYPGVMTMDDLENYKAVYRQPVWTTYKGYQLVSMNMPSTGMTTIAEALNMLENIDYMKDGFDSLSRLVYFLNTMGLSFADRNAYTADSDWENVPVNGLLDKDYALQRSKLVNTSVGIYNAPPGNPPGAPAPDLTPFTEGLDTTSYSIIDTYGNMLVCTSTLQSTLGSHYVVPGRGFMLNNELTDFSSAGINRIVGGRTPRRTALPPLNITMGGKRPRSSMTPTIIFKDGVPRYGLGSPNGPLIISAVAQVTLNLLDWGMDVQTAVDMPRVHSGNTNSWILETGFLKYTDQLSPQLIPSISTGTVGVVAVVENAGNNIYAAADSRKQGSKAVVF